MYPRYKSLENFINPTHSSQKIRRISFPTSTRGSNESLSPRLWKCFRRILMSHPEETGCRMGGLVLKDDLRNWDLPDKWTETYLSFLAIGCTKFLSHGNFINLAVFLGMRIGTFTSILNITENQGWFGSRGQGPQQCLSCLVLSSCLPATCRAHQTTD